jgi:hypothetical protein
MMQNGMLAAGNLVEIYSVGTCIYVNKIQNETLAGRLYKYI